MNPHNLIVALDPPGSTDRLWRCEYCHAFGLLADLERVECTFAYPPCEHCGQTPTCAPDCSGVLGLLIGIGQSSAGDA